MKSQTEVLPKLTDRDEAFATLDHVQNQLRAAAAVYEELVALVEGGDAVLTPIDEVARALIGQAEPMREALSVLMPYVKDMRDGDGCIGPVLQGIEEALDAADFMSASVSIAKAFGFACAVCCAMERSLAGLRTARNAPPIRFDADSCQELVMDQRLVDALGYLLRAHWDEVMPSVTQRPAIGRASRLYIRRLCSPAEPLDRMDIEVLSSIGLWAISAWADLALRAPVYVDAVERLQCVMLGSFAMPKRRCRMLCESSEMASSARGDFIRIEPGGELLEWIGEAAYVTASVKMPGMLVVYPQLSYLMRLRLMIGSQCPANEKKDVSLTTWHKFARMPKAVVSDGALDLPASEVKKAKGLRLDGFVLRAVRDHMVLFNLPDGKVQSANDLL